MRVFFIIISFLVIISFSAYSKEKDGSKLVKLSVLKFEESKDVCWLLFQIKPDKGYHTYWLNPGDAGLATRIIFDSIPKNIEITDTLWQTPEKLPFSDFASYGYGKSHYILYKMKLKPVLKNQSDFFVVKVDWLVCKESCLPGKKAFTFKLNKLKNIELNEFVQIIKTIPTNLPDLKVKAIKNDETIELILYKIALLNDNFKELTFYPYEEGYLNNGKKQVIENEGNIISITLSLDPMRSVEPTEINGILVASKPMVKGLSNKSIEIKAHIFKNH